VTSIKRVYLDLDRTLLDTQAIMQALTKAGSQLYGFDIDDLRREYDQVNKDYKAGRLRAYSYFDQMSARGISAERARLDMEKALAGKSFLYSDVPGLLAFLNSGGYEVKIVTFGKTDYQMFKFGLAPELAQLPIVVVSEEKNVYLSQQSSVPSLLIDDKEIKPLPDWCKQALIDRKAPSGTLQEGDSLWRINNLALIANLLYNDFNQKET